MNENININLGDHFENFVKQSIRSGKYKNKSEVIRAALRLLEIKEQMNKDLRNAIDEGINSGVVTDFNPEYHLKQLKRNRRENDD